MAEIDSGEEGKKELLPFPATSATESHPDARFERGERRFNER